MIGGVLDRNGPRPVGPRRTDDGLVIPVAEVRLLGVAPVGQAVNPVQGDLEVDSALRSVGTMHGYRANRRRLHATNSVPETTGRVRPVPCARPRPQLA